ncbi:hypothetical protein LTR53_006244 [Teratosphaeriaceae sp. CCFEE 6253]|nr:hypothetical protein LTR53_006244 [Teratosphaeriaceae sp. CCFEE 6253]
MADTRTRRASGPRGPTNTWDAEQRMALHVLYSHFNLDAAIRTRIFNTMFHEHLLRRGIPDGLSNRTLYAQYHERAEKHAIWGSICAEPSTEEQWRDRHALTSRIQALIGTDSSQQTAPVDRTQSATRCTPGRVREAPARFRLDPGDRETTTPAPHTPAKRIADFAPERPALKKANTGGGRDDGSAHVVVPASASPNEEIPGVTHSTPRAMRAFQRLADSMIMVTPKSLAMAKLPLVPVAEAIANWNQTGLYYRYWDYQSMGTNSPDESNRPDGSAFLAGRFQFNNSISVTNCLLWLLVKAFKQKRKGVTGGKIALIDASALDKDGVYHLPQFHYELKKHKVFTNGQWLYGAMHEFLVWRGIPQRAIVSTFDVDDLISTCERVPALQRAIQLETITMRGDLKTKIRPLLRAAEVRLDAEIAVAIAKLCRVLGLGGSSCLAHLEHVVSDVIQGWCICVEPMSAAKWAETAAVFAQALCSRNAAPTLARGQQLQSAWLYGVKAGLGEFNVFRTPRAVRAMESSAEAVGLESPTRIMLDALKTARSAILSIGHDQDIRYEEARTVTRRRPASRAQLQVEKDVRGHDTNLLSGTDEASDEDSIRYDDDLMGT